MLTTAPAKVQVAPIFPWKQSAGRPASVQREGGTDDETPEAGEREQRLPATLTCRDRGAHRAGCIRESPGPSIGSQ